MDKDWPKPPQGLYHRIVQFLMFAGILITLASFDLDITVAGIIRNIIILAALGGGIVGLEEGNANGKTEDS